MKRILKETHDTHQVRLNDILAKMQPQVMQNPFKKRGNYPKRGRGAGYNYN